MMERSIPCSFTASGPRSTRRFRRALPARSSRSGRRTSYTVESVDGRTVTFAKGMDFAMSRVGKFFDDGTPVLQSSIERVEQLYATDDTMQTQWRVGEPVTPRGDTTGLLAADCKSAVPGGSGRQGGRIGCLDVPPAYNVFSSPSHQLILPEFRSPLFRRLCRGLC